MRLLNAGTQKFVTYQSILWIKTKLLVIRKNNAK